MLPRSPSPYKNISTFLVTLYRYTAENDQVKRNPPQVEPTQPLSFKLRQPFQPLQGSSHACWTTWQPPTSQWLTQTVSNVSVWQSLIWILKRPNTINTWTIKLCLILKTPSLLSLFTYDVLIYCTRCMYLRLKYRNLNCHKHCWVLLCCYHAFLPWYRSYWAVEVKFQVFSLSFCCNGVLVMFFNAVDFMHVCICSP